VLAYYRIVDDHSTPHTGSSMGAVCSACIAPKDADPSGTPGAAAKYEVANLTPREKQVLREIERFPELLELRDAFHDADVTNAGCLSPERGVALVLASIGETHEPNALEAHTPRFRRLATRLDLDDHDSTGSSTLTQEDLLVKLARVARLRDAGETPVDALDEDLFRDLAPLLDAAASAATSLANKGLSEFDAEAPEAETAKDDENAFSEKAPSLSADDAAAKTETETAVVAETPMRLEKPPEPSVGEPSATNTKPGDVSDVSDESAQMAKDRLERVLAKSKMPSAVYLRSIPSLKNDDSEAFDDREFDAEYKLSSPTASSKDLSLEKQYALSSPGPSGDFGDLSENIKAARERAEKEAARGKKGSKKKQKPEFRNF
jgi:hypothetical protein